MTGDRRREKTETAEFWRLGGEKGGRGRAERWSPFPRSRPRCTPAAGPLELPLMAAWARGRAARCSRRPRRASGTAEPLPPSLMPAAKALPPPLTADEEGRLGRAAAEEGRGASCEEDGSAGRRRLISEEKEKGEGEKIEKRESILESNRGRPCGARAGGSAGGRWGGLDQRVEAWRIHRR